MSIQIYVSRNFVEFGPFHTHEITDFHARGVLGKSDHVRIHGNDEWHEVADWVKKHPATPPPAKAAVEKVAKKAAPRKSPVKKAAAKSAPAP